MAHPPPDGSGGFDPRAHWFRQAAIERVALANLVPHSALDQLSGGFVHHGNLLIARAKITPYNQHCSPPFFRALVVYSYQVYSGEGADNVIQSALDNRR